MSDTKHPAEVLADWLGDPFVLAPHGTIGAVREWLRRIPALDAEIAAWRRQCDTLTHQVITCGVAAHHPDPSLTTRGAYAGKWNSPQAEDVRKLRSERDRLRAALDDAQAAESVAQAAAERVPLTDEQKIAEALRRHGLTLVKTATGYDVLKLGQITAARKAQA